MDCDTASRAVPTDVECQWAERAADKAADVVAYCAFLDAVAAIATGKDTTSTALPARPAYPAGT